MKRIRIKNGSKVFIDGEEGIYILRDTAWVGSKKVLPLWGPIDDDHYQQGINWVANESVYLWEEESSEED